MTVSSTINRISYNGNDVTTAFDVPFVFFDANELQVIERVLATGTEAIKSLDNDYTVSGGDGTTGTITAGTPPPSTVSWTILRKTQRTQAIDFTDNDPFPAETHERGLDRLTLIAQDSASSVDRAIRFPATDPSTLHPEVPNSMMRAGKYLAFDSEGVPVASAGPTGSSAIPVSSFIEGLLDDADAESARATLGLTIGTDVAPAGISGDFVGRVTGFVGVTPPSGWLLLNGDTIGNIASGAVQESADYEDLFVLIWNSLADSEAPVSSGRGASAANDWIAGKTLALPDLRGRSILGSGTGTDLTARIHGAKGGAETHLLTADESGVPQHTHGGWRGGTLPQVAGDPDDGIFPRSGMISNTGGVVGGAQDAASAHNNMQPFLALNYIVKY
jgi:microcystin-dependent protein